MRRAFTLIEVVLAMALLGVLAFAATSWTVGTLRVQQRTLGAAERARQSETLDRLIRSDLFAYDQALAPAQRREGRVWVSDGTLHMLTRDGGVAEVTYGFDASQRAIVRTVRGLDRDGRAADSAVVTGVAAFGVSIDEERSGGRWSTLAVTVEPEGETRPATMECSFPREWAP